ncbi:hypothetical protein [Marispirochaeta sp.]|uniref:hypothetical protein n=1 Tax=Marispirochaeta sp. TaxID=2038653 RepID=UPI0029C72D19|nr:hypothetical protein [Marispirochaeta sp.]
MERLLLIAGIVLLGYVVLPLSGGVRVRRQWRRFREAIYKSMEYPIIDYPTVRTEAPQGESFRFFGQIEAVQGDEQLWLTDGALSVQVDLKGVEVYTLPALNAYEAEDRVEDNELAFADASPTHLPANRITSFPQGTRLMVSGELVMVNSRPVFRSRGRGDGDLLVLIYDGAPCTILRRSIWSGRQRNEYWNQLTPASLTLASFSLFILTYVYLRSPGFLFYAHIALTMSLAPLAPLLPPGLLLFSLYRRIWRTGRYLRAERDLLSLPARRFPQTVSLRNGSRAFLPDGSVYRIRTFRGSDAALEGCPGGKIRTSRAIVGGTPDTAVFYAFGCSTETGNPPSDPFAERVLIPGEPRLLSLRCSRGARYRELLGAGIFVAALLINLLMLFMLLWFVLV